MHVFATRYGWTRDDVRRLTVAEVNWFMRKFWREDRERKREADRRRRR